MSIIAKNIAEAQAASGEFQAGGTDRMDRARHGVSEGPVVDISRLPDLNKIEFNADGTCSIGALVSVHDLASHDVFAQNYPGLAKAAGALANPQIRRAASVGGSLLQRNRCWYYRHEGINCYKKGGKDCPMRSGNHQYGICFDLGPCVSPHPSTLGMALLAYDAEVEIAGKGRRSVKDLYGDGTDATRDHLLNAGEILTHIHLPKALAGEVAAYFRSISRARAEWPLVEVLVRGRIAAAGSMEDMRVAMGGVANIPLELPVVAAYLNGKIPAQGIFVEAGKYAIRGVNPLPGTAYKVELVSNTLVATLGMMLG